MGDPPVLGWHETGPAPFPDPWRSILIARVPFYRDLDPEARARFEEKVRVFVLTKAFSPANGLVITEEMKVVVAATACRLTMNLPWEHYAQVKYVTLSSRSFRGEDGVKAIGMGSRWKVSVSWPALVEGLAVPDDGDNVGYHEFAHALDESDGSMDGEAADPGGEINARWEETMSAGRAEVQRALDEGVEPPIDRYGAKSDVEFFAVATEWFFERPRALRARLPDVHELLRRFYRQDPPLEDPGAPRRRAGVSANPAIDDPCPPRARVEEPAVAVAGPPPPAAESPAAPVDQRPAGAARKRPNPVRVAEPRIWGVGNVLHVVGWTCVFVAFVLGVPCAGRGLGRSPRPGASLWQELVSRPEVARRFLLLGALGVAVLCLARLLRRRSE